MYCIYVFLNFLLSSDSRGGRRICICTVHQDISIRGTLASRSHNGAALFVIIKLLVLKARLSIIINSNPGCLMKSSACACMIKPCLSISLTLSHSLSLSIAYSLSLYLAPWLTLCF